MSASSASARSRSPTTTRGSTPPRRSARSRPASQRDLALRRLPAVRRRRPDADALEPGLTPLVRADRLAEQLGVGEVWVKNDAANPTHSFKDRVVAVALAKARELGFETVACASTGNLANAVAAHAAAAGLDSYVFVPADLEEQKLLATGVYGTSSSASRHLRRRQPALHRAARGAAWAFVNVNLRPYYAEGSKTLAYETAEQLGWELPDRVVCPIASGRCSRRSAAASPSGSTSAWSRASCPPSTAPRPTGCSPVATAFATATTSAGRSSPTRSRRASRSATRRTAPTRSSSRADRRLDRRGHRRRDPRRHPAARRDDRDLHRDRRRRDDRGAREARRGRRASTPDERVVVLITGEGLKTLDATREGFEMHEIEPTLESFEAGGRAAATAGAPQSRA